jgi:hypothetical protein
MQVARDKRAHGAKNETVFAGPCGSIELPQDDRHDYRALRSEQEKGEATFKVLQDTNPLVKARYGHGPV